MLMGNLRCRYENIRKTLLGAAVLLGCAFGLFWCYQGYILNVGIKIDNNTAINFHTFVNNGHLSIQKKGVEKEAMGHWKSKKALYNLLLLERLTGSSDRFSVVSYSNDRAKLKCNWMRDLKAYNGSCGQVLLAEASISMDVSDGPDNDCLEIDLLPKKSDFSQFLSRLQSVLPMEWTVAVQLYDFRGPKTYAGGVRNVSSITKYPPRYVVGSLKYPSQNTGTSKPTMETTFDLGNSKRTILLAQDCRGCAMKEDPKNGCPDSPPTCDIDSVALSRNNSKPSTCWASRPDEFVPNNAFDYTNATCGDKNYYNKDIFSGPICKQCFQNGTHSRFVAPAKMKHFSLDRTTVRSTEYTKHKNEVNFIVRSSPAIRNFDFGALIRTVPQKDRIWSNVGIGAGSDFLTQLNITRVLIDFDYYETNENSKFIFNPNPILYKGWKFARYHLHPESATKFKRIHAVHSFYFEHLSNKHHNIKSKVSPIVLPFGKKKYFHIDTGNDGISIFDEDLIYFIGNITGGCWVNKTLYTPFSPETAPALNIVLSKEEKVSVKIPGSIWSLPRVSRDNVKDIITVISGNSFVFEEAPPPVYTQMILPTNSSQFQPGYPTIFHRYNKNVFGLPFLSSPGIKYVFDDEERKLYVGM